MKTVSRARLMFLGVFVLSTCCLYYFKQRDEDLKEESKHSNSGREEDVYYRDYRGYLYPREYFQYLPIDYTGLFNNISLKGRHADTTLSPCQHSHGNNPSNVRSEFQMTDSFEYLPNFKNPCWYDEGTPNKTLICIPYYYFIGTPKAGSTDLYWRIRMHPHVAKVSFKEQRWFDACRFTDDGKQSFSFYAHEFHRAARLIHHSTTETGYHHKIVGDGSPSYLFNNVHWPFLPGNEWCVEPRVMTLSYIHRLFPDAKLILIVRNPVDRLYSDYLFNSKRTGANKTAEEFHAWAKTTIENYTECFKKQPFRHCLYSRKLRYQSMVRSFSASIYSRLILDALRIFPRDQLFVVQMEDYSTNMSKRLKEVFEFLGLEPLPESRMKEITQIRQYNEGKHYKKSGPMLPVTRRMIYNFYKPFNEELARILNDDKYLWLEK